MQTSDLIALAAVLAALLSALYARHARDTARRANDIAIHQNLRPVGAANGTRYLVAQIDSFKWEIDHHGPLAMPDVESKASDLEKRAWRLQRLLDRIAGGQNNPHDPGYATAEDNVHGLVDWFANEHRDLRKLFQPYLGVA